jgi:hypothetical protein
VVLCMILLLESGAAAGIRSWMLGRPQSRTPVETATSESEAT